MGIKGLWQALREYVDDGHLSQFRGQRVAVDMYVWLHRCLHRSVRINTDAVLAYLEAKYNDVSIHDDKGSMNHRSDRKTTSSSFESISCPPVVVVKQERVDGVAAASSAMTTVTESRGSHEFPLPPMEDVLVLDDQFITLVVDKVAALQRFGVTPICVFDGDEMPMKGNTDEERQRRRQDAFAEAMLRLEQLYCEERRRLGSVWSDGRATDHHSSGAHRPSSATSAVPPQLPRRVRVTLPRTARLYEEAVQLMEKAVDISTELAHAVIQVLREERSVECIVAPYEADAQLAYLCREGYVAAAASEDSDLIAYYCPCVISKLDTFSGKCEVLQPAVCAPQFFRAVAATGSLLGTGRSVPGGGSGGSSSSSNANTVHSRLRAGAAQPLPHSPQSPFASPTDSSPEDGGCGAAASTFTYESFLLGCIMAGCDYVANLRNIGIKKAFKLVAHASSLRQVFALLETEYGFPAEELAQYRRRLLEAFYCFAHHLVYCPLRQEIVPFHPLPAVPSGAGGGGGSEASSGTAAALLKTQLVGTLWEKAVAQDVCARCLCDPCTLRLYRGTYQSCVTSYLQRTRRGQTSLKAYAGFEELSSNKVVVHLGGGARPAGVTGTAVTAGVKRERGPGISAKEEVSDFGPPLKKRHEASGFLGAGGTTSSSGGETQRKSARVGEVVVVRSRYFLMRGRTAVCEPWSASDDDDDSGGEADVNADDEGIGPQTGDENDGAAAQRHTGAGTSSVQPDVFALHTARPRAAAPVGGGGLTPFLGLSRPPPPTPPASPSPSSVELLVKPSHGPTDDTTSSSEAATAVGRSVNKASATDEDSGEGGDEGFQGSCADASIAPRESRRVASPTAMSTAESGATVDSQGSRSDNVQDGDRSDDTAGMSTHAQMRRPCLAETPDVEPYAYPISGLDAAPTPSGLATAAPPTKSEPVIASSVQPCACPFGYWQCNRAHSVFESCFLGKQWCRDDGPATRSTTTTLLSSSTPTSPATADLADVAAAAHAAPNCAATGVSQPSAPASPDSTSASSGSSGRRGGPHGFTPRGFRPPRSTAFPPSPADATARLDRDEAPASGRSSPSVAEASLGEAQCTASPPSTTNDTTVADVPLDALHARSINQETSSLAETPRVGESSNAGASSKEKASAQNSQLLPPPPPPMPSHRAAVRMAIFDKMAFKKTS